MLQRPFNTHCIFLLTNVRQGKWFPMCSFKLHSFRSESSNSKKLKYGKCVSDR